MAVSTTEASARGDLGPLVLHVGELLADVLHRHRDLVLALERDLAGEHLVEHDAERVEVGLAGDGRAQRLLGRDVVGRAEHAAVGGQPLLVERAGDPEVGDLGRALLVDQHVLGLDVAVDDVAGVGGAERPRDLDRVGHRLGDRQAAVAADPLLERLALHVLEHDVGPPVVLAGSRSRPTMCGCESWATARASRRKRSSWSESLAISRCISLIATWRCEGLVERRGRRSTCRPRRSEPRAGSGR